MKQLLSILVLGLSFFFFSGTLIAPPDEDCLNLPDTYFNYADITLPPHLQLPNVQDTDNTPPGNPITDAGATLGRVLFYDKKLSVTNTVACADCHKQELAFTDDSPFSQGFAGGFTGRNSMSLVMARFYPNGHFFWDERAATLEDQILLPIQDPLEMGQSLNALLPELQATDYYPPLFAAAFGTPEITSDRLARAVSQFIRSMVSYQSRYDQGRTLTPGPPTAPFPNFTPEENRGKQIFFSPNLGNCAACHGTDAFTAPAPRNNGLNLSYVDNGLGDFTGNPQHNGLFKVPSLRNVALTAPFMHDGRFETLMDVVLHYDHGVQPHPNLSPQLRESPGGPPRQLLMSQEDRQALVAFMHTLTDTRFTTDERWSDPFCEPATAVSDPRIELGVRVYPNPVGDWLQVEVRLGEGEYDLELFDERGRLQRQARFRGDRHQVPAADLPAGVYLLRVRGEGWQKTRKVVVH